MKSRRLILILGLLIIGQSMVFAYRSNDFVIGTYSYLKPYPPDTAFNSNILNLMKSQGKYNVSICDNPVPSSESAIDIDVMIQAHYNCNIDPWITDYPTSYDASGEIVSAGTHALSTGNYWRFEAEFFDTGSPVEYSVDDNNSNKYFHQFSKNISNRIGYATEDTDNIFHRKVWACSPDTAGVVLHGLRQRFIAVDADNAPVSPPKDEIGSEFRFTQWDKISWNEQGHLGQHYLSWNKLYVRYNFRHANGNPNENALSFRVVCKNNFDPTNPSNPSNPYQSVPIRNVLCPGNPQNEITCTFGDLTNFTTAAYPDMPLDGYRAITFEIDLNNLRGTNTDSDDDTFLNTAGYWNCSLFAIDPYVYSYGNGTIYLDSVEIFDKMYNKLDENPPTDVISWLNNRLNVYGSTGLQGIENFYTLDEPQLPHFASYSLLNEALNAIPNSTPGSSKSCFATINWTGTQFKKPNGQRFSLPELFTNPNNGFEPKELMIDFYPLDPENNWNTSNQDDLSGSLPIQSSLDYKMLSHYFAAKARCIELDIPLYIVPVSAGWWNSSQSKWDKYMMPTANMQKCLQLLPLCYGVDGVINWKLYNDYSTSKNCDHDHEPYEAIFDRDRNGSEKWYALVEKNGDDVLSTPQFEAICQANDKLVKYGEIIKSRNLNWNNALCVKSTGPYISPVYNYAFQMPIYDIGAFLDGIHSYDPQYPSNQTHYQGYFQVGFFEESNAIPYYMVVNRRTDFVENGTGCMEYLTPTQLRTNYDVNGYASGFSAAPSQNVAFAMSDSTYSHFGTHIGLYDPYDSAIYKASNGEISVEIGPGDGKLLQMCSTLPAMVNSDATLKTLAHIAGSITIDDSAFVNILPGTETWIQKNSVITVKGGSRLKMSGTVCIGDSVEIIAEEGGILEMDASNCEWGCDARVTIDGGCFTVGSGSLSFGDGSNINAVANSTVIIDSVTCSMGSGSILECYDSSLQIVNSTIGTVAGVVWNGLRAERGTVVLDNSTISNAESNRMRDVSLISENCIFNVPENSLGLYLSCYSSNNSSVITATQEGKGFFGEGENNFGIGIDHSSSYTGNTLVKNIEFRNLSWGFLNWTTAAISDTIKDCTFVECQIGIDLQGTSYNPWILASDFISCQKGILLEATSPRIHDCDFDTCQIGILAESTVSPEGEIRRCEFLDNGNNINPLVGIESRGSNIRIANNDFYDIHTAILCHAGSNLNLGNNAKNKLKADSYNIRFLDNSANYRSTIQVYTGHNDFYHTDPGLTRTDDYSFDENYYVVVPPKSRAFDGSYNWYGNSVARIECPSPYPDSYVKVLYYDPEPNVPIFPEEERMAVALGFENENQHENAKLLYKAILDEDLDAESKFLLEAIDGFYRTSHKLETPSEVVETYLQSKIVQYEAVDYNVVSFLKDYLVKQYLSKKDFQAAIDVIQARLDNPSSPIDSVLAVLDLEIVFMLYDMEDSKAPIRSKYTQYKYPTKAVYRTKHNEHWDLLKELSGQGTTPEIPIPPVATISRNYPNPFNPSTTIEYSIPAASNVRLSIYNIKGQRVAELVNADLQKGHHKVVWNGKDSQNRNVSTGIYLIRMEANGKRATHKTMLMK